MLDTIEDALEILAGVKGNYNLKLESEEFTIMNSIARQVFRGTALTDRQYDLTKDKLKKYILQFEEVGLEDLESAIENLRKPLRQIDRSKWIKIVDIPDNISCQAEGNKFIAIRFPFKKSDIMLINNIKKTDEYYHDKGSHVHYFVLNEQHLLEIGDNFFNKEYIIDDILKERYAQIKNIQQNSKSYLPYVVDKKVTNVKESIIKLIEEETDNDLLKIYDRRFRYCIENINIKVSGNSLEEVIANRQSVEYQSKPSQEPLNKLLYALYNLDRFPMLVVLENKSCESQLHEIVTFFRDLIPSDQQSVLFRDEEADSGFNQLIKQRKLNNWVDNNTKIVYINSNKLPKLLLETEWKPNCVVAYNSNNNKNVQLYIKNNCDLVVHREETVSPFMRMYR